MIAGASQGAGAASTPAFPTSAPKNTAHTVTHQARTGRAPAPASTPQSAHTVRPRLSLTPTAIPTPVQTIAVNSTADTAVTPGECATSAGTCTLRAAIVEAGTINQPVGITVPAGTYTLALGALDIVDPAGLTINGAGASSTVVTAAGASQVVTVDIAPSASGTLVAISGLTLSDGIGTDGGNLSVDDPSDVAVLTGVTITGGNATNDGGGIYNDGNVWLTNSTVSSNTATSEGGGIYNGNGSMQLTGDTVSGNLVNGSGGSLYGAGVYNSDGPMGIDSTSISSNHLSVGNQRVRLRRRSLRRQRYLRHQLDDQRQPHRQCRGRHHTGGYGAGLYADYGLQTLTGTSVSGNTINANGNGAEGGGIYEESGAPEVNDTITNNTARDSSTGGEHHLRRWDLRGRLRGLHRDHDLEQHRQLRGRQRLRRRHLRRLRQHLPGQLPGQRQRRPDGRQRRGRQLRRRYRLLRLGTHRHQHHRRQQQGRVHRLRLRRRHLRGRRRHPHRRHPVGQLRRQPRRGR